MSLYAPQYPRYDQVFNLNILNGIVHQKLWHVNLILIQVFDYLCGCFFNLSSKTKE